MNKRNSSESNGSKASGRPLKLGGKTIGGIGAVVLIAVYSFAQPILKDRFGVNLPSLRQNTDGQVVADTGSSAGKAPTTKTDAGNNSSQSDAAKSTKNAGTPTKATQKPAAQGTKRGPLADRAGTKTTDANQPTRGSPTTKAGDDDLLHGLLHEVSPQRYMSPAGLQYEPGSSEGHRLEHLRRHTKDMTGRPVHGVFDGGMEGALKTIDQAYEKAKQGVRTSKKVEGGRTIYTVDMGKRIGFVGGRDGQRKRNPMARRVRLVLEGTSVITAFPMN